ncbi:MAG: hypothetical protein JWQ17_5143 [Tardiphaga sp.]|nr:hypothetical protein [Tardiphaga sp.]
MSIDIPDTQTDEPVSTFRVGIIGVFAADWRRGRDSHPRYTDRSASRERVEEIPIRGHRVRGQSSACLLTMLEFEHDQNGRVGQCPA